jgi:hypothetical protein
MPTTDKRNGVTVMLRNWLFLIMTSNVFITFKIAVTGNSKVTVTVKNG